MIFLGASLLFYILFAGADFGAGILELFLGTKRPKEQRKLISRAMAPVWEANHVWLILAIVILFMGFPRIYTTMSIYLHLPMIAILLGIVARGCAFAFRYYDTLGTLYHRTYSAVFAASSLWTSFFLGVLAGAMMLGKIDPSAQDFYASYITPWLNGFCISLGLFVCALFAFLAAVYLVGETEDAELRKIFRRRAFYGGLASVIFGFIVFLLAEFDGLPLARNFIRNPVAVTAFITATFLWIPFWRELSKGRHVIRARMIGATIVTLVLVGWFAVQFPIAIRLSSGAVAGNQSITFQDAAAPDATLWALLETLIVGSVLIFPALAYLLKTFKWQMVEK